MFKLRLMIRLNDSIRFNDSVFKLFVLRNLIGENSSSILQFINFSVSPKGREEFKLLSF